MIKDKRITTLGSEDPKSNFDGGYSIMNNEELYKDIKSYFKSFIDTDETELSFLVLYATGTHYFDGYE